MKMRLLLSILVLCLVMGGQISSQENKAAQKEEEEKYKVVDLKADHIKYSKKTKIYIGSGNVVIKQEDITLLADQVEYNREEDTAKAMGNLKVVDPENTLTGELLTADFKEKKVVVTGNVKLVREKRKVAEGEESAVREGGNKENKKEKEEKKLKEYIEEKATIICDKVEYFYKKKEAFASGNLKIVQEDKTAYGDKATYLGKDELIIIEGDVRVETEEGEKFAAQKIAICFKEDEEWIEAKGAVETTFKVKEKKAEEEGK